MIKNLEILKVIVLIDRKFDEDKEFLKNYAQTDAKYILKFNE